jgi:Na+/H+-dicarboxylate symporter
VKALPLHWKIIIGLVIGIIYSFISSAIGLNEFTINWIDPFGKIFIRILKFIAVPLVLFSIIGGVAGLQDVSKLGRMGGKTLLFYLATTVFAIAVGLILVNVVKPGSFIEEDQRLKNRIEYELWVQSSTGENVPKDGRSILTDPNYKERIESIFTANEIEELKIKSIKSQVKLQQKLRKLISKKNQDHWIFWWTWFLKILS